MPSYRVTLTIGALRPGSSPALVLPKARDAVAELATVEASDVGIVAGVARITVRFTAEAAELALQIGQHAAATTDAVAEVLICKVTERVKGRWYVVR